MFCNPWKTIPVTCLFYFTFRCLVNFDVAAKISWHNDPLAILQYRQSWCAGKVCTTAGMEVICSPCSGTSVRYRKTAEPAHTAYNWSVDSASLLALQLCSLPDTCKRTSWLHESKASYFLGQRHRHEQYETLCHKQVEWKTRNFRNKELKSESTWDGPKANLCENWRYSQQPKQQANLHLTIAFNRS